MMCNITNLTQTERTGRNTHKITNLGTRIGDVCGRVKFGKPSRYVTSQLGRLSLLPSVGR